MRKFLFCFPLFLSSFCVQAQNELDEQLSQIDTSSITSGILYERVSPFANLYNFNQSKKFNTASYSYLSQALSELYRASNKKSLISLEQLEQRLSHDEKDLVDLVILNTPFQILNYNEASPEKGGLLFNEATKTYTAISNKPSFYTLQATLVAPTKKAI
ncbi:hypothetical protein [Psychroserpens burtonensis]|nr:hypothetical protein [Psychroserpens burtonensis]